MRTLLVRACWGLMLTGLVAGPVRSTTAYEIRSVAPTQFTTPVVTARPFVYPTTAAGPAILGDEQPEPAADGVVADPVPTLQPSVDPAGLADCGNACAAPAGGSLCCGPCWYVYGGGLIFTRNDPRFAQLSYDDTNLIGQVLDTHTGLGYWDGGAEIRLGYFLDPCRALEFSYWGIYGDSREATVYAANLPGNLNTAFDFGPVNIGADNVNDLFDAAEAHRVRRDYSVNNFELNLLNGNWGWHPASSWEVSYLAGVRYLRFAEDFHYASADAEPVFGADLANEAYYDIDVDNDLWGFQLGGRADWRWSHCFSLYVGTKFGIYGNRISQHSQIYNINGTAVVGPGNPLAGREFDIESNKTVTSFVGELDLGMNLQLTPRLSAVLGYRAVAVSGVGYATDQIPSHFADLPGVADIDHNANLILHGAYVGGAIVW